MLTHLHFAERILGPLTEAETAGAVFPDTGIACGLPWGVTHAQGERVFETARTETEHEAARGILTHGARPPGLDHYADESYAGGERGYCFQLARPLSSDAARVCNLPEDMGWWKAHNFIEMAADLIVHERHPQLGHGLLALLDQDEPIASISSFIAAGLDTEGSRPDLDTAFRRLPVYMQLDDLTPLTLARKYEVQVRAKHGVLSIDVDGAADLIEASARLVRPSLDEFLDTAEHEVRRTLARYPGPRT